MAQERVRNGLDAVIDAYKKDVDVTLIRENLRLSPEERLRKLMALQRFAAEVQRAGREARQAK
ncbi:MAG: hypothetical protein FJ279_10135 [Planctomycetes bacterium]|nr:hypothetical protein [Planctomycetota bacterium]MBM4078727.1 hypothetical protein [Planctomycetota bacterium]MBM4086671.1 hypothetical protein [Planctomycetota bacterium]